MGLFTGVLLLPLAPVRGVVWVAELLYEQAQRELTDPARVRAELSEVQRARTRGEISQDEADRREEDLLQLFWQGYEPGGGLEV